MYNIKALASVMAAWVLAFSTANGQLPPDPTAQELVKLVVAWSEGLKSFSGKYQFRQEPTLNASDELTIEYRFEGKNKWMRIPEPDRQEVWTRAVYNGVLSQRLDRMAPDSNQVRTEVDVNMDAPWNLDVMELMFPDRLILTPYTANETIAELLSRGANYVIERDNETVLSHWVNDDIGSNVDVYFTAEGHVSKLEWCFRFGVSTPEEFQQHFPGICDELGVFNVRVLNKVQTYLQYQDFDGYAFPTFIETRYYDQGEEGNAIKKAFTLKELTPEQYVDQYYKASLNSESSWITTFAADVPSIQVNIPLSKEDFVVQYGVNAEVYDGLTGEMYVASNWPEYLRAQLTAVVNMLRDYRAWLVMTATLAVLVVGRRYWLKRRPVSM